MTREEEFHKEALPYAGYDLFAWSLWKEKELLLAEVNRLQECVSPRYSIPIEEALGPLKPCPFCGSQNIGSHEGEVYCNNCDAANSTLAWQFRPPTKENT